jgi:hypothetical protein
MFIVNDIIGEVSQVTGKCDQTYLFSVITRAVETLARKQCQTNVTWDPMMTYLDLPVQQDYYVYLPYQVEKPIKVNLNGQPAFSHSPLYEFTQNGPGSEDIEAGFQWQDRLTSPIQRRFPRQANLTLTAVSDSADDTNAALTVTIRGPKLGDYVIDLPIAPAGTTPTPSTQIVRGVTRVVKPVTVGTVTLWAGPFPLAYYYPSITFPEFSRIKLSQKGTTVRMLARLKTMPIQSLMDVIPLNSKQAVILQCAAIKFQDDAHPEVASPFESQAVTYLNEEQAARNQYMAAAAQSESSTALNLTIGQRDSVIVADIYDEACRIFGFIGRPKIFDKITQTMEVLFNQCQYWDGLIGVVTLKTDQDYYVALPRYIDTPIAANINRRPVTWQSPWFEFSFGGLGEFNDLHQDPGNWEPWWQLAQTQGSVGEYPSVARCSPVRINGSNRLERSFEEVGSTPLAFRLMGPTQLYCVPVLPSDNGCRLTVYGYFQNEPVVNSQGQWGVDIPCYSNRTAPSKYIFDRIERVTKDPTYSFLNLFGVNPFGPVSAGVPQTIFLSTYWPWDTEPSYRLFRAGVMCKRIKIRYKKNWQKITQLTDPLHLRSRPAIVLAMTAFSTITTGGAGTQLSPFQPTAPLTIAQDQLTMAQSMLDDEWRSRNPNASIQLQWNTRTYGMAFPQVG